MIIYFTVFDTKTKLGELERTLRFSDRWGTHRGFMWNKAIEAFGGFNFFQKLFGTGPDTFFYTFSPFFDELYDRFGDGSTDAAHNEYINYLLNLGIVGLTSYLAFTGGALVRAFKAAKKNPLALVFASAVVAYMAQAVVNIALPIATPLFIICVALCEAVARAPQIQAAKTEKTSATTKTISGKSIFFLIASILMTVGGIFSVLISYSKLGNAFNHSHFAFLSNNSEYLQEGAFIGMIASILQLIAGVYGVVFWNKPTHKVRCLHLGIATVTLSVLSNLLLANWLTIIFLPAVPVLYIIASVLNRK